MSLPVYTTPEADAQIRSIDDFFAKKGATLTTPGRAGGV